MKPKISLPLYIIVFSLFALSIYILSPFVTEVLWGVVIVASTWPIFLKIERLCKYRRPMAVALMTLLMILLVGLPLVIGLFIFAKNSHVLFIALQSFLTTDTLSVPSWLVDIPLAGDHLSELWKKSVIGGMPGLLTRFETFVSNNSTEIMQHFEQLSDFLIQIILTIIVASFFYAVGDRLIATSRAVILKNLGAEASHCVQKIGDAIRSVAFGVVGAAVLTALIAAIGLSIAQVPHTLALTIAIFITGLLMVGPLIILIPVCIWMIFQGAIGWAIFIAFWTVLTILFDEWVTAALIKNGAEMPAVMIFFGVLGGLACFGVIGIFLGPVILEIAYAVSCLLIEKNLSKEIST